MLVAFDNLIWPTFDTFIWPTLGHKFACFPAAAFSREGAPREGRRLSPSLGLAM